MLHRNQEQYATEVLKEETVTIAGLDEEMEEICELMNVALGKRKLSNLVQSRAVLLYGHSGTGKTTLAKVLGKISRVNVVSINAPDLYSKFSSSAEETITELFQEAIEHSPSIIIIDEIDILCPLRSNRITDTEKRIVSTLLLMFDNLNTTTNSRVFIIATTNKPDNIDPAFRRCGRIDREIEIPTPNPKNRKAILASLLNNASSSLNEDQLQQISANTHGFVGADLVALCSRASLNASKRENVSLNMEDFKLALKKVRPSAMREVQIEVNIKG